MEIERKRMIIKVSELYYMKGLNQQDIANRLRISRSLVSRMLTKAREEGIVEITIRNPFSEEQEIEEELARTFGLNDVLVSKVSNDNSKSRRTELAKAGAAFMETVLKDNDIVGVMAGHTISALSNATEYFYFNNVEFIPLIGGWGPEGAGWHANGNTSQLAEKLNSRYWLLNAPAIVASSNTRNALLQEPEIYDVLNRARKSTVALVGIGQISNHATFIKSGNVEEHQLQTMIDKGAVASLCTSFLNNKGEKLDVDISSRMIGLSVEELRDIPRVIAIAYGEDKVEAITATLRGKWIDGLIIDLDTAKSILKWNRLH